MDENTFKYVLLGAVVLIVSLAIYRYGGAIKISLKAWGVNLNVNGENQNSLESVNAEPQSVNDAMKQTEAPQKVTADGGSISNLTLSGEQAKKDVLHRLHPSSAHALPPDLSDFTGRQEDAERLIARLLDGGGSAAISALNGLGGIGKSALAVHVARKLATAYPAGQMLFELAGTSDTSASPSEIMSKVIISLHPTAQLPDDDAAHHPFSYEPRLKPWKPRNPAVPGGC